MGRPQKSESRSRRLNLSLTEAELASVQRRAEALGMRPVHFGRALLLTENTQPAIRAKAASTIERLIYGHLARIGNNLNQMMRHLHTTGDPLPPDLDPLLKDIRQLIARLRP